MLEKTMMKVFPEMMTLAEKIEIVIPSTVNVNEKANTEKYVVEAEKVLSGMFGGATAVKAHGSYLADNGDLVMESVTKVYAFADKITEEKMVKVLQFVKKMKEELMQECIGMEVNGKFYLV